MLAAKDSMKKEHGRFNINLRTDFDNLFISPSIPIVPLPFCLIALRTSFIELSYVSSSVVPQKNHKKTTLSGEGIFYASLIAQKKENRSGSSKKLSGVAVIWTAIENKLSVRFRLLNLVLFTIKFEREPNAAAVKLRCWFAYEIVVRELFGGGVMFGSCKAPIVLFAVTQFCVCVFYVPRRRWECYAAEFAPFSRCLFPDAGRKQLKVWPCVTFRSSGAGGILIV